MKKIIKKYIKSLIFIAILLIACNLLRTLHPFVMKQIVDIDFKAENIEQTIIKFIIIYAGIHVLLVICKNLRNIVTNKTMTSILKDIREKLFNKLLKFKMSTFNKYNSAELYTRLTADIDNLYTLVSRNFRCYIKQYNIHNFYGNNDVCSKHKSCINRNILYSYDSYNCCVFCTKVRKNK